MSEQRQDLGLESQYSPRGRMENLVKNHISLTFKVSNFLGYVSYDIKQHASYFDFVLRHTVSCSLSVVFQDTITFMGVCLQIICAHLLLHFSFQI